MLQDQKTAVVGNIISITSAYEEDLSPLLLRKSISDEVKQNILRIALSRYLPYLAERSRGVIVNEQYRLIDNRQKITAKVFEQNSEATEEEINFEYEISGHSLNEGLSLNDLADSVKIIPIAAWKNKKIESISRNKRSSSGIGKS